MLRVPCLLSLLLLLTCSDVLQQAGSVESCYNRFCVSHIAATVSNLVSLHCNTSMIIVNYTNPGGLQALEIVCSHADNSSNVRVEDILCEGSASIHTAAPTLLFPVFLVNTSFLPGDECTIRGCYDADFDRYRLSSDSCIIERDCMWSSWSNWTDCDKECGGGMQTRYRSIEVTPRGSGQDCLGPPVENRTCNNESCPVSTESTTRTPTPETSLAITETDGTAVGNTAAINDSTGAEDCNTTNKCHEYAVCLNTPQGPECSCLDGYDGNGLHCVVAPPAWIAAVVAMVTVLVVGIVLTVCIHCCITGRKKKGLDHKRLEKLMGTFDPNFTPHLSSNLTKVTAMSEVSVFDSLYCTHPPADNDYITLQELGIHIHSNHHAKDSDSESSMELRIAELSEDDSQRMESLVTLKYERRMASGGGDSGSIEPDARSNYSLDLQTVERLFQIGRSFHNANYSSGNSEGSTTCRESPELEQTDFIEDGLRINIDDASETDIDEEYMCVENKFSAATNEETVSLEQRDFIENLLRINVDDISATAADEEYINVDGVCFTYPSNEHIDEVKGQWMVTSRRRLSLPQLDQAPFTVDTSNQITSSPNHVPLRQSLSSHLSTSVPNLPIPATQS